MLADRPLGLTEDLRELPLAKPDRPVFEAHIEPRAAALAPVEQIFPVSSTTTTPDHHHLQSSIVRPSHMAFVELLVRRDKPAGSQGCKSLTSKE